MATLVNGATWGTWAGRTRSAYLNGTVSRSGNTVTLSGLTLYFTIPTGSGWGTGTESVSIRDTSCSGTAISTTTVNWGFSGTTSNTVNLDNASLSVGSSDTSHTLYLTAPGGDCAAFTISFPSGSSSPTGLSVTPVEVYADGAKFDVSISSYGTPSSVSGRFIEAGIAGQNAWQSPALRSAKVENTTSAQITVNNASPQSTTLVVRPNTQYYYGMYAWNTVKDAKKIGGQIVTLAAPAMVSIASTTDTSITINYEATADGGHYDKTIEYSIDGGTTWQTVTTITGGSATSGNFTVSGLTPGTDYQILTRVSTTAGVNNGATIVLSRGSEPKLYGSANSVATEVGVLYGSHNDTAVRLTKFYGSANGEAKLIHQDFGHLTYT